MPTFDVKLYSVMTGQAMDIIQRRVTREESGCTYMKLPNGVMPVSFEVRRDALLKMEPLAVWGQFKTLADNLKHGKVPAELSQAIQSVIPEIVERVEARVSEERVKEAVKKRARELQAEEAGEPKPGSTKRVKFLEPGEEPDYRGDHSEESETHEWVKETHGSGLKTTSVHTAWVWTAKQPL
tara:strand:- start:3327 stop:3872 length:546 start_codon:yes stop_codon:yes gene_type:complete